MEIVVEKGSYRPLKMAISQSGITITIENVKLGVTEKEVTFDPADWPGVTIIEKREGISHI